MTTHQYDDYVKTRIAALTADSVGTNRNMLSVPYLVLVGQGLMTKEEAIKRCEELKAREPNTVFAWDGVIAKIKDGGMKEAEPSKK